MKHLSLLEAVCQNTPVISQEEFIENYISMESALTHVEEILKQSDHALDVAVSMENIVEVLDQIETVTPMHNALVMIAGDLSVAGTDIHPESVVPSLESDEGEGKEGMKEKLKSRVKMILNMVKEFLAKAWDYFKELFNNVGRYASATNERADAFKKRYLSKKDDAKKKVQTIVAKPILDGDKPVVEIQAVLTGLHNYTRMMARLDSDIDKMRGLMGSVGDTLIQVTELKIPDAKMGDVLTALRTEINSFNDELSLFGGFKAEFSKPTSGEDNLWNPAAAEAFFRSVRFKIHAPESNEGVDYAVPDIGKLAELIDAFKDVNSFLSPTASHGIHFTIKNSEKFIKEFERKMDGVLSHAWNEKEAIGINWFLKAPAYSAMMTNMLVTIPTVSLRNTLFLVQRLSAIIDLSLKAYGV